MTSLTTSNDLPQQLRQIGLQATAEGPYDLLARATKQRWATRQLIEEIARSEAADKAARSLKRRLQ
jgi:hypothetical protein